MAKLKMLHEYWIWIWLSLPLPLWLLLLPTLTVPTTMAFGAYFPITTVKFRLPINERSENVFSKLPLARFQVLMANNTVSNDYIYILEDNELLSMNHSTGEIFIRNNYKTIKNATKYLIVAWPKTNHAEQNLNLTLEIIPETNEAYCAHLENVCFWETAHYKIAEFDSWQMLVPISLALSTPAARYLCPIMDVKYELVDKHNYWFEFRDNVLYSIMPWDFENRPNQTQLQVHINCIINVGPQKKQYVFSKKLNVTLLDRNDNGPMLQENGKFYIFNMMQPYFKVHEPIGEKIIFLDKDAINTNAHLTYTIKNDMNNLVRPICNAYEADHTAKPHTVISCQLVFARNGLLGQQRYCFTLVAEDETIDVPSLVKSAIAFVCLQTNVTRIHESDHPMVLPLGSRLYRKKYRTYNTVASPLDARDVSILQSILPIAYQREVFVYRTANIFNRITQPENFRNLLNSAATATKFMLSEDRSGAFGITTVAGIIYVKNATALINAPETDYSLKVSWHDAHQHAFIITVHLMEGRPQNVSCELKIKSRSQTCAQIKYPKQCAQFCGLATNGGTCEWRGTNLASFEQNYASCVPDAKHCPDNVCDPLEKLNLYACPQDCTLSSHIVGPHSVNKDKRGIFSASGTCICEDNGKCSCAPLDTEESKSKRRRKNETQKYVSNSNETINSKIRLVPNFKRAQQKIDEPTSNIAGFVCNKSCMLMAIVCPLIFIILIICLLCLWRQLLCHTLVKETTITKKAAHINDECDIRNIDLPLMKLENSFKFDNSDSKWEFDREKLNLDIVLGEGEFGKVVKGYATEIAGLPGVTTVAVKMLKKGANSVEYMALLSEFQLLQEVSHPNVIKLLGACTKSETPLIIIEYARYGSLRSYLRLSRKIECIGVDFTDGMEAITVKNILTFAWQICKGMAYLTEIKLVHRDLAARNVLLADGKICKISDFGLTRDVYEDDAYLKRSHDRVPVKWMAPESLADHVYTTKSDVWAFGVLCWELITLGASPYPGIPPQNLYYLLKTGYRMERPDNCSEQIYSIVRTCWTDEPNSRPSFKYLASQFEKLLGNNAKYVELGSNAFSNPLYCCDEAALIPKNQLRNLCDELGVLDNLDHLWSPPKIAYDTQDCANSCGQTTETLNLKFQPPPGYDMPRPLIEANTIEQVLRYENDLRFPLNIQKTICAPKYNNTELANKNMPHYSVPVKRGRSYMDLTNNTLIPDNLDNSDFEKHLSKSISFRFSSLLNLKEQEQEDAH